MSKGPRIRRTEASKFQVAGEHAATGNHTNSEIPVNDVPQPIVADPVDVHENRATWEKVAAAVVQEIARLAIGLLRDHLGDDLRELRHVVIAHIWRRQDLAHGGAAREIGVRNLDDPGRFDRLRLREDVRPYVARGRLFRRLPERLRTVRHREIDERDVRVVEHEKRRQFWRLDDAKRIGMSDDSPKFGTIHLTRIDVEKIGKQPDIEVRFEVSAGQVLVLYAREQTKLPAVVLLCS